MDFGPSLVKSLSRQLYPAIVWDRNTSLTSPLIAIIITYSHSQFRELAMSALLVSVHFMSSIALKMKSDFYPMCAIIMMRAGVQQVW